MAGPQADEIDWENMTNKELHDKFEQMMSGQVGDVLNRFEEAMDKIDAMEKSFETKLDNKFNELLKRLPQPPPIAPIAPLQRQQQRPLPIQFGERSVFLLRMAKLLVLIYLLLMLCWLLLQLLLVPRRMMIMRAIMRMRLIKIRTKCSHQHHHQQVYLRYIFATVGPHHHLRYEIRTIFLN